jgi:hypothetical protein
LVTVRAAFSSSLCAWRCETHHWTACRPDVRPERRVRAHRWHEREHAHLRRRGDPPQRRARRCRPAAAGLPQPDPLPGQPRPPPDLLRYVLCCCVS